MVFSTIGSLIGGFAGTAAAAGGAAGITSAGVSGALGALGTLGGLAGQAISYVGQAKAERLRKLQMNLEATRQKRAAVRQGVIARAQALSSGEAQGAMGSSSLAGGLSQIAGQVGSNVQGISQTQQIGNQMFNANAMTSMGQTIASIGGAFNDLSNQFGNQNNIERNWRVWNMQPA